MTRYFAISAVIFCILILSLKDSLNIAHSLLHKIPNIFHYHHHIHHDHSHHNHNGHDHTYRHFESEHDLTDHISKDADVKKEEPFSEENKNDFLKTSIKVNWYINALNYSFISRYCISTRGRSFLIFDHYKTYFNTPPSPPPESV